MSAVREQQHGRSAGDADEQFGSAPVEAGFMYPSWTYVCRFAEWVGCDVAKFTGPTVRVKTPFVRSSTLEVEIAGLLRARYHSAIVRNTMLNLNDRYGIASLEMFHATQDRVTSTAAAV